jgi:hypothetical protein
MLPSDIAYLSRNIDKGLKYLRQSCQIPTWIVMAMVQKVAMTCNFIAKSSAVGMEL